MYQLGNGDELFLAIKPSGRKTWIFNCQRSIIKRRNNLSFGAYPEVGLKLARDLRPEARALLAIEVDPKEYREQQNEAASTFHTTVEQFDDELVGHFYTAFRTLPPNDKHHSFFKCLTAAYKTIQTKIETKSLMHRLRKAKGRIQKYIGKS